MSRAICPPPNPRSSRRKEAPSEVRSEKDEGRTELHVIAPAISDDAVHDPSDLNQQPVRASSRRLLRTKKLSLHSFRRIPSSRRRARAVRRPGQAGPIHSHPFRLLAKRQGTGAVQDALRISGIIVPRAASWSVHPPQYCYARPPQ